MIFFVILACAGAESTQMGSLPIMVIAVIMYTVAMDEYIRNEIKNEHFEQGLGDWILIIDEDTNKPITEFVYFTQDEK
jgi:hypothetical protein